MPISLLDRWQPHGSHAEGPRPAELAHGGARGLHIEAAPALHLASREEMEQTKPSGKSPPAAPSSACGVAPLPKQNPVLLLQPGIVVGA